jgi:hypothetical protein
MYVHRVFGAVRFMHMRESNCRTLATWFSSKDGILIELLYIV